MTQGAAENREYARRMLTRVDQHNAFTTEQVGAWSRWLTASLLALNGAGALAALGAAQRTDGAWIAGAIFAVGIIMALLSGTCLQEVYNEVPIPLLHQDEYWTGVSITGMRDGERERALAAEAVKASRWDHVPPILGWISGVLFLAAIVVLGIAVTREADRTERRCAQIERDMLSAKPKRTNSVELYQALGCQP